MRCWSLSFCALLHGAGGVDSHSLDLVCRLNKAEVLEYFMYFYPTDALPNTPGFNINKEAAQSFMKSLENHATAFRSALSLEVLTL